MDSEDKKVNVSEEETEDATTQGEPELTPAETKQPETEAVNPELEGKEAKPKDEKSPESKIFYSKCCLANDQSQIN